MDVIVVGNLLLLLPKVATFIYFEWNLIKFSSMTHWLQSISRNSLFLSTICLQVCQKLGWKGKNGRFDITPLVLQARGGKPEIYTLPEELRLEVDITHPT